MNEFEITTFMEYVSLGTTILLIYPVCLYWFKCRHISKCLDAIGIYLTSILVIWLIYNSTFFLYFQLWEDLFKYYNLHDTMFLYIPEYILGVVFGGFVYVSFLEKKERRWLVFATMILGCVFIILNGFVFFDWKSYLIQNDLFQTLFHLSMSIFLLYKLINSKIATHLSLRKNPYFYFFLATIVVQLSGLFSMMVAYFNFDSLYNEFIISLIIINGVMVFVILSYVQVFRNAKNALFLPYGK